jgi:hypothetical protein
MKIEDVTISKGVERFVTKWLCIHKLFLNYFKILIA